MFPRPPLLPLVPPSPPPDRRAASSVNPIRQRFTSALPAVARTPTFDRSPPSLGMRRDEHDKIGPFAP